MVFPQRFKEKMQRLLGAESDAFFESFQREQFQALRVNTLKLSPEEFEKISPFSLRPVPWAKEGFYYETGERPGKHPYHEAGLYYIQEPSAMAVGSLAAPKPGERVLDLCAAPGGKTTHLASFMKGRGLLVSNEIHPARAKILSSNIERMGITNAVVTNEKPKALAKRFPEFFDRIVVDAPCSGEGMFCKEEQAVLQWSLQNVSMCAERQQRILEQAALMLRPGGILIYSTCTFSPEENEGSVSAFLKAHPDFFIKKEQACKKFDPGHPEWIGAAEEIRDTFRLWPHRLEGAGHYAAILQRDGEGFAWKNPGKLPEADKEAVKQYEIFAKGILRERSEGIPVFFGEQLYLLPCVLPLKGLRVLRAGLQLGTVKKNRFEPAHALALSLNPKNVMNCRSLKSGSEETKRYLRGEALNMEGEAGWSLVLTDGYPLGWGKQTGDILKNHYPRGLRWM